MTRIIGLLILVLLSADVFASGRLYRYENEQGNVVIDDSVPPELLYKGYEVLNSTGRVIERVPRALTKEELAAQSEEEKRKLDRKAQAAADKKLLTIFSGPEDAERARDRKLEALDVYINVTKGNILKLQADYDLAQSQAAEKERAGQPVPDYLVEKLNSLERQIKQAEVSIAEKDVEKADIRAEYAKDIDRLVELKKMRNQR